MDFEIIKLALESPLSTRPGTKVKAKFWHLLAFLFLATYVCGFIVGAT